MRISDWSSDVCSSDLLIGKVEQRGYTLVPLNLHYKNGRVKLDFGLGRGKKLHDKRDTARDKDWQREKERVMKHDTRNKNSPRISTSRSSSSTLRSRPPVSPFRPPPLDPTRWQGTSTETVSASGRERLGQYV